MRTSHPHKVLAATVTCALLHNQVAAASNHRRAAPPFQIVPTSQISAKSLSTQPALTWPNALPNETYIALGLELPIAGTLGSAPELLFLGAESYLLFMQEGMTASSSSNLSISDSLLTSSTDPLVAFTEPSGLFSKSSSPFPFPFSSEPADFRLLAVLLYKSTTTASRTASTTSAKYTTRQPFNWTAWAADMNANPTLRMDFDMTAFAAKAGLGAPVAAEVLIVKNDNEQEEASADASWDIVSTLFNTGAKATPTAAGASGLLVPTGAPGLGIMPSRVDAAIRSGSGSAVTGSPPMSTTRPAAPGDGASNSQKTAGAGSDPESGGSSITSAQAVPAYRASASRSAPSPTNAPVGGSLVGPAGMPTASSPATNTTSNPQGAPAPASSAAPSNTGAPLASGSASNLQLGASGLGGPPGMPSASSPAAAKTGSLISATSSDFNSSEPYNGSVGDMRHDINRTASTIGGVMSSSASTPPPPPSATGAGTGASLPSASRRPASSFVNATASAVNATTIVIATATGITSGGLVASLPTHISNEAAVISGGAHTTTPTPTALPHRRRTISPPQPGWTLTLKTDLVAAPPTSAPLVKMAETTPTLTTTTTDGMPRYASPRSSTLQQTMATSIVSSAPSSGGSAGAATSSVVIASSAAAAGDDEVSVVSVVGLFCASVFFVSLL